MDQDDETWLRKVSSFWKLTAGQFEKAIEFLETAQDLAPTLLDLESQSIVEEQVAEKIYDYWIDKRLATKHKLIFTTKKETKTYAGRKKGPLDPYVVFRQNPDKVHTRKNRAKDNENYLKMLLLRNHWISKQNINKAVALNDQRRHNALLKKFENFQARYQSRNYEGGSLELESSLEDEPESDENITEIDKATKPHYEFQRQDGCEFFMVS